ncbi:MAG: undecaprenyl-diphosphate phosphatase [Acidobacteriota bacterium]
MGFVWIAIVLGIVEGLTEFVPVSSTGHLIVVGRLLGFEGRKESTFEIFIQLGAILAIVVVERRRFVGLLRPRGSGGFAGPRGCALLAVTTLPILIAGYPLRAWIKGALFGPTTVAAALLAGGVGILLAERYRPPPRTGSVDALTWRQALAIGLFQCLALWPGTSRAAATIAGGLLSGLERRTAATYSFLAAVPVMVVATLGDLWESRALLAWNDLPGFAIGLAVAFLAAWAAVRTFVAILGRFTLRPFAWYRIAVAPALYFRVR